MAEIQTFTVQPNRNGSNDRNGRTGWKIRCDWMVNLGTEIRDNAKLLFSGPSLPLSFDIKADGLRYTDRIILNSWRIKAVLKKKWEPIWKKRTAARHKLQKRHPRRPKKARKGRRMRKNPLIVSNSGRKPRKRIRRWFFIMPGAKKRKSRTTSLEQYCFWFTNPIKCSLCCLLVFI